jgi:hypothetical protein
MFILLCDQYSFPWHGEDAMIALCASPKFLLALDS